MKAFLIDMFRFNLEANTKMVKAVRDLEGNEEMLRHLSHLANCQYKWLERITLFPATSSLDWWTPVSSPDELCFRFEESTQQWIEFLNGKHDKEIDQEMRYAGNNGDIWKAELKVIALQLIFHSFHHRAQIQMMIRSLGHTPGFIDYIGSRAKKEKAD